MLDSYASLNKIRRRVFEEIAKLAYEGGDYSRLDDIPYQIYQEEAIYRESLEELKRKELLVARAGRIFLTDKGRDLSNYCLAKFLLDK